MSERGKEGKNVREMGRAWAEEGEVEVHQERGGEGRRGRGVCMGM